MKEALLSVAAVAALAATAVPAAAQSYGYGYGHDRAAVQNINARQAQLEQRIQRGLRSGALTPREAIQLRAELRNIDRLEQRYRSRGLTQREYADLDRRLDRLTAAIRFERRDRQYGYRW